MDTKESSAPLARPSTKECPCVCLGDVVFIGHLVEEAGEELEVIEAEGQAQQRKASARKESEQEKRTQAEQNKADQVEKSRDEQQRKNQGGPLGGKDKGGGLLNL